MRDFTEEVVITALKEMFSGNHFSICTIDSCLKITGCIVDGRTYDALSALHCIKWRDMSQELREEVLRRTISMFQGKGFDLSMLDLIFNGKTNVFELNRPKKGIMGLLR